MSKERLAPILGARPTTAALSRFNQRVRDWLTRTDSTDVARAHQHVAPPALPIVGHGQQLALTRMTDILTRNAVFNAGLPPVTQSRQVKRQAARIAAKPPVVTQPRRQPRVAVAQQQEAA